MMKYFIGKKTFDNHKDNHITDCVAKSYSKSVSIVSLLRVCSGSVIVEKCVFSFKILTKSFESLTPAIIIENKSHAILDNCEIVGHSIYNTIGILSVRSHIII